MSTILLALFLALLAAVLTGASVALLKLRSLLQSTAQLAEDLRAKVLSVQAPAGVRPVLTESDTGPSPFILDGLPVAANDAVATPWDTSNDPDLPELPPTEAAWLESTLCPAAPPEVDAALVDGRLLDTLASHYWRLEPFDILIADVDDGQFGWRVVEFGFGNQGQRVVSTVFVDDPRAAIQAAIDAVDEAEFNPADADPDLFVTQSDQYLEDQAFHPRRCGQT